MLVEMSLATAAISYTISNAQVFRDIRDRVVKRTWDWERDRKGLLGELITCPYCVSHWVSFALTAVYRPRFLHSSVAPVDWVVSAFVIVGASTVITNCFRALGAVVKGVGHYCRTGDKSLEVKR